MRWHDIAKADSPQLDELAATYGWHPLHVADCRNKGQRTKVDDGGTYLFIILMLPVPKEDALFSIVTLALFVGADFVIGVHETRVPLLEEPVVATGDRENGRSRRCTAGLGHRVAWPGCTNAHRGHP
jgi:Mg2+ and Co2+ transporter CorA